MRPQRPRGVHFVVLNKREGELKVDCLLFLFLFFSGQDFENIIATLDPKANRRLVLACHYDSKPSRSGLMSFFTGSNWYPIGFDVVAPTGFDQLR